ncbi:hypothetical protein QUV91_02720 [Actinomyces viscosus]|uniref:Uncharacterized protein n=1 Tax=Actinomyces viscosus TaxID=1656 RepID=A0ABT7TXT1_ACTVI|nr:hypothetical protein [Actinomyces viscosus]MDM8075963.1 hypothetical protein [Actinomyces viscosus]
MGRWLPQRGWLGHDGLSGDLNSLTRPTVPSGAIQGRMLAKPEERRGVVGRNCLGAARASGTGRDGLYPTRTQKMSVFGGEIV